MRRNRQNAQRRRSQPAAAPPAQQPEPQYTVSDLWPDTLPHLQARVAQVRRRVGALSDLTVVGARLDPPTYLNGRRTMIEYILSDEAHERVPAIREALADLAPGLEVQTPAGPEFSVVLRENIRPARRPLGDRCIDLVLWLALLLVLTSALVWAVGGPSGVDFWFRAADRQLRAVLLST